MVDRFASHEEAAQHNWVVALQTYHTALSTYRRVLEVKSHREAREAAALPLPLSFPTPVLAEHMTDLSGLTRREHEVADLIARGFSNRQIAESLVLTRGTVANHVAHILSKVGATNRTQVAARVFSSRGPSPGADASH